MPTAVAQSQVLTEPFVVPLRYLPDVMSIPRFGITASFAGATLEPPPTYLFDTGSAMFVSAYQPGANWWGPFTPTPSSSGTIHYDSTGYGYSEAGVAVTLSGTGGALLTTGSSYSVAQATQRFVGQTPQTDWLSQSSPYGTTPPLQGAFYGTFGADLTDPKSGLYSFINQFQMGQGMTKGFVVDATSASPTLTLGFDQPTTARFAWHYPMISGTIPNSYEEFLVTSALTFSGTGGGQSASIPHVSTLFDTGTPVSMLILTGSSLSLPAWT